MINLETLAAPDGSTPALIMGYDTETTGLPLSKDRKTGIKPASDDPAQPHIVQLGARLIDPRSRETVEELNLIIRPDGYRWENDPETDKAFAAHRIEFERAMDEGVSRVVALEKFLEMSQRAHLHIAHNDSFDRKLLRIALIRQYSRETANAWYCDPNRGFYCTCDAATPIVNMEATQRMKDYGHSKKPKRASLIEAYQFFNGRAPEKSHDALADVDSCMNIFWHLADGGTFNDIVVSPQDIQPRYFQNEEAEAA